MRVTVNGHLAGNAFSCRWNWNDKTICWVTQLVVHRDYRERGLAVGMLNQLGQDKADFYGIMSSHPAACLAAAKAFSSKGYLKLESCGSVANPGYRRYQCYPS